MAEKFINNKLMTQQTWRQMACPQKQPVILTHLTVAQSEHTSTSSSV